MLHLRKLTREEKRWTGTWRYKNHVCGAGPPIGVGRAWVEAFLHEKEIWFEDNWNPTALGLPSRTSCAGQLTKSEPALLCERGCNGSCLLGLLPGTNEGWYY